MTPPDAANNTQITDASAGSNSGRGRESAPNGSDIVADSSHVSEAFDEVPAIGDGHRWYDFPYRLIGWLSSSWRRKALPHFAREWLYTV